MKEILLAACAAFVWVYVLHFEKFKFKPINCETCMGGWFCCGLCIINKYVWWEIPFYMCAAMITSIVLTKIMKKI